MNKKKLFPITNAGTVSILTVFVILAMVAFAALWKAIHNNAYV